MSGNFTMPGAWSLNLHMVGSHHAFLALCMSSTNNNLYLPYHREDKLLP